MLKAVIVDDEPLAIEMLRRFLLNSGQVEVIGEYTRPSQALLEIGALKPDAAFLDIEMLGTNGVELAKKLTHELSSIQIVFVTAYRDYAVNAFEIAAVDYLLKPTSQQTVDRAVTRLIKQRTLIMPAQVKTGVSINCFGQAGLMVDEHLVKWRTAKVEELFFYLFDNQGKIVSKEEIIDRVWPEFEDKPIGNNLYTTIYRLKKTLKDNCVPIVIERSGDGYIMEVTSDIVCDVKLFNTFISKGESAQKDTICCFEKTAALYRGDYLETKDYFWCIMERTRLQEHFLDMIKQMAVYYLRAAEYKKAEQILINNSKYWCYDEDAYKILLEVFFMQGDRAAIIKYYNTMEQTLKKELGFAPQPEIKRLYAEYISSV